MFKVNYLNATLWILFGILLIILLVVFAWRIITKNNDIQKNFMKNKMFTSNKLIDLSWSLERVYDVSSLVNILFKNKFAKNGFSLITLLAFKKQNAYLILNPIKMNVNSKINVKQNKIFYIFKNKNKELNIKSTYEILRFFKSITLNVKIIIPTECKYQNKNFIFKPIEEIGDYIKNDDNIINQNNIINKISKLEKINLFKRKTTNKEKYV